MLLKELKLPEENRDLIISSFMKAKDLKTKRITYISDQGYGSGVNIYITLKNKSFSPLDSFLGLWLKNTIWEEELDDFSYSKDECEKIFDELFKDVASSYDLEVLGAKDGSIKLAKAIKIELENIDKDNTQDLNVEDIEFMDVPGIYVNRKYTTKNPVIIKNTDKFIDAIQLYSNDIMGTYSEMFLESKERYIYFF